MIKKICAILVIFFLISGNIFAYSPTTKDTQYINKINTAIDKIYKTNHIKIDNLVTKINNYLKKNVNASDRNKYILGSVLSHINKLKVVVIDDFTVDNSLSSLMGNIDKLKGEDGTNKDSFSNLFPEYDTVMKNNNYATTNDTNSTNNNTNNQNNTSDIGTTNVSTNSDWDNKIFKNVYEVGPNKKYLELQDVPWESLQKSSIVKIYQREKPYYTKFVVNVTGTKDEPVVIIGVPNSNSELPVISGSNALTSRKLNYWNEERSIIKIGGSSTPANTNPSYIYIENLEVKNANPNYKFTDDSGNINGYTNNAAGIHIEYGNHITIKNCKIHDNGNGIFSTHFSSNIVIAGNYIYDNGTVGSIYEHNTYTESNGITYEYNKFGKLKSGASGNNLKDRSANTVIRYNYIEGGNRQLDLVDSDYDELINGYNYQKTYVYGNVLIEPSDETGNSQFIHYGGDSGTEGHYRNGTLYLYHNTFVSYRNANPTIVRMSLNSAKAEIINNVFAVLPGTSLAITSGAGQINLSYNYLPEAWKYTFESSFLGAMNINSNISGYNPGFIDLYNKNFHLNQDSALKNKALNLTTNSNFQEVEYEYRDSQSIIQRNTINNIGAFE